MDNLINSTNNQQNLNPEKKSIDKEKLLAKIPEVSPKLKKDEIVEAYNKLVEKYKEEIFKEEIPGAELKEEYSKENLIRGAIDFKENFSGLIEKLETKIISEFEKLNNIRENISAKKKELERIYDTEISLEYLGFLLRENKRIKNEFDLEIKEAKRNWEEERKERDRKWKWEEEDYKYSFAFEKQKREDEFKEKLDREEKGFLAKQREKEGMLAKREEELKKQEEESKRLEQEVADFPARIEKVKKEIAEKVAKQIRSECETSSKFREEKYKSSLDLLNLENKNLKATIVGLQNEIKNLISQLEKNKERLQEIVLKVIEEKKPEKIHEIQEMRERRKEERNPQ